MRKNVELGPRVRGVPRRERRERADQELARVRLGEFADWRVYELSGGMQRRCQIARVLADDPDVMLMDEPFGALDALTREHLQGELRTIWRETGRTIVFVTHSVDEAAVLGSRVIVLSPRPGRVVYDRHLPFAASVRPLSELRADPELVATCAEIRQAIDAGQTAA